MTLRPVAADDRSLLLELDSDPDVMRFLSGGKPSTSTEIDDVIGKSIGSRWLGFLNQNESADRSPNFADDRFVGWFGLGHGPEDDSRELGYRLRKSMWGQGLATEGSLALIDHGFGELALERIWAQTMAVNTPSRRVMERCGLRYVRTFHLEWDDPIDGVEHGDVEYELLRADWAPNSTSG